MNNDLYHLDADEAVYFKRQLEVILSRTYDEVLADLPYAKLFPITSEVDPIATEATWRSYKSYGFAKLISDYATDFPRVDLAGSEQSIKIKSYGVSWGYNIMEIRRAAKTGFNLTDRKAKAARRALEEKMNRLAFLGDSDAGIQGFINYPGITEYTVPATGTGATKTWSTKTADQILVDLFGIINAIVIPTFGKEMPNRILLPLTNLTLIKTLRLGTYNDTTVYEFFKKQYPEVELVAVRELVGAGAGGTNRMMAYNASPDKIRFEVPMAFEQFPEQQVGLEFVVPAWARVAGIIMPYVAATAYADGI